MARTDKLADEFDSPSARAMDEVIELAIQERSPYPEKVLFLDADAPEIGPSIWRAADEGRAIVLVDQNGTTRTLLPEPHLGEREA
ncbi:MAG TPA: hypothetical protein VN845_01270 [Solirubrobacteraceae bacterium]|nr:hypothetical protein [Solirubrobacteraceae bacterium]